MRLLGLCYLSLVFPAVSAQIPRRSPPYDYTFTFPLPIPPTKEPITTYTNPTTGIPIDFYEIDIKPFTKQHFPNLQPANLVGYDGIAPGPTFRVRKGRESVVRFINHGTLPSAAHLHGGNTRAPWDGWAEDMIPPGSYKDYYYPGQLGARTLWYHDHASMFTTLNLYAGQSGAYIIEDPEVESRLALPAGRYDVPLVLDAHYFTGEGDISDEAAERTSVYGDTFSVNGQILPYFDVEPRKYRFRLINVAASRNFNITLKEDGSSASVLPFWVIASDSGFLPKPVETRSLIITMAERWEIVIDFGSSAGKNFTVAQKTLFADADYAGSDKLLQFRVGNTVTSASNNGALPSTLVDIPALKTPSSATKTFLFSRRIGAPWTINGKTWSDPVSRILANPPLGTVEKWVFRGAGGWSHPVHAHLIEFTLLERGIGDPNQRPGRRYLEEYEKGALKDVATLGENESVTVLARFTPWAGVYTFHCHNTVHEDYSMMVAFNVSALKDFGYDNVTSQLEDPMDPRFRARPYAGTDLTQVREVVLPGFAELNAYPNVAKVEEMLDEYWETKTRTGTPTTTSSVSSNTSTTTAPSTATTEPTTTAESTTTSNPAPTESVDQYPRCGPSFGNAQCPDSECCSQHGWCGSSDDHCREPTIDTETTIEPPAPTPPVDQYPRCGPSFGNAQCPDSECCSQHGWCGSSDDHCSNPIIDTTEPPAPTPPVDQYPRCGPSFSNARCPDSECCSQHGWCGSGGAYCS